MQNFVSCKITNYMNKIKREKKKKFMPKVKSINIRIKIFSLHNSHKLQKTISKRQRKKKEEKIGRVML